jgi:hypothetical protein
VVLLPLLSRQSDLPGTRFVARFFQSQPEALAWLELPAAAFFATKDCIYVSANT